MTVVILMDFKQKFKNSLSPKVLAVAKSKRFKDKFILSATMLVLANCGGGGGGTSQAPSTGTTLTGTVVKGPLSNAVVFVFATLSVLVFFSSLRMA